MISNIFRATRPELSIVVYDTRFGSQPFSRPHSRLVAAAVAEQPMWWWPTLRVERLLVPGSDRVARIESITFSDKVTVDASTRLCALVCGTNFSFGARLGRDFFDPRTDNLRTKFGDSIGRQIEILIQRGVPDLFGNTKSSAVSDC